MRGGIVFETIRKIAVACGLRTAFHSHHTLGRLLSFKKPTDSVYDKKSLIYCNLFIYCESCRLLQVRMNEHKLYAQRGNAMKSRLAEHFGVST